MGMYGLSGDVLYKENKYKHSQKGNIDKGIHILWRPSRWAELDSGEGLCSFLFRAQLLHLGCQKKEDAALIFPGNSLESGMKNFESSGGIFISNQMFGYQIYI